MGSEICLDFPSVGATENLIMAATLAQGKLRLEMLLVSRKLLIYKTFK